MAWRKENGPDGLPVWRGKDSLYNVALTSEKTMAAAQSGGAIVGCLAGPLVVFLLFYGIVTHAYGAGTWALMVIGLCAALFVGALVVNRQANGASEFIGDEWQLAASPDGLQLKLKVDGNGRAISQVRERWRVPLDIVARVETGRTTDYVMTRRYGVQIGEISQHEWQVFLFLNDGTRRVVYHANADRDGCAALAASIREYVETARAAGPATQPAAGVAPSQSSPARPVADGFDL